MDTSSPILEDTAPFIVDTAQGALDEEPEHTVTVIEQGTWSLTPLGGPYTTLVGTLTLIEYIDGPPDAMDTEPLACEVEFALTGTPAVSAGCSNCDVIFDVQHQLVSGNLDACHDPDRPRAGQSRRMGFDPVAGKIRWQRSTLWFDWYNAQQAGDQLSFSYTATLGVTLEEE